MLVSQLRLFKLFEFKFSREVEVASLYAFFNFETIKVVNLQLIFCDRYNVSLLTSLKSKLNQKKPIDL
jgi:hypothetical protein